MSGIIDPDVDSFEVMQCEAENAVDFFGVANVAGKGGCAFEETHSCARGFGTRGISREQHDARALGRECFRNRLANAHRCARDYDYLTVEFHDRVCMLRAAASQYNRRAVVQSTKNCNCSCRRSRGPGSFVPARSRPAAGNALAAAYFRAPL